MKRTDRPAGKHRRKGGDFVPAESDDDDSDSDAQDPDEPVVVGARVRVRPGTDAESLGVIVEDFGEMSGHGIEDAANQIGNLPRRWAVALDDGTLTFVDSDQLAPS